MWHAPYGGGGGLVSLTASADHDMVKEGKAAVTTLLETVRCCCCCFIGAELPSNHLTKVPKSGFSVVAVGGRGAGGVAFLGGCGGSVEVVIDPLRARVLPCWLGREIGFLPMPWPVVTRCSVLVGDFGRAGNAAGTGMLQSPVAAEVSASRAASICLSSSVQDRMSSLSRCMRARASRMRSLSEARAHHLSMHVLCSAIALAAVAVGDVGGCDVVGDGVCLTHREGGWWSTSSRNRRRTQRGVSPAFPRG